MHQLANASRWPCRGFLVFIWPFMQACGFNKDLLPQVEQESTNPKAAKKTASIAPKVSQELLLKAPCASPIQLLGSSKKPTPPHAPNTLPPPIPTYAQYGFTKQKIAKDGNCLFRAVATQLKKPPFEVCFPRNQDAHYLIRQLAVAHVQANQKIYQDSFPSNGFSSINQWLAQMRKDKTWGGEIAIRALSEVLQANIIALRAEAQGAERPSIYQPACVQGTICLYYENGNHYSLLQYDEKLFCTKAKKHLEAWLKLQPANKDFVPPEHHPGLQVIVSQMAQWLELESKELAAEKATRKSHTATNQRQRGASRREESFLARPPYLSRWSRGFGSFQP